MIESKLCAGLILFFFFSLSPVVASRIPLGSKLSVAERNYWVSPNGDFAFGFFNRSSDRQPDQYGVGVRFNSASIPVHERAVVWVAGADVLVGRGSFLHLTDAGDVVLFDSTRRAAVWTSNTSRLSVDSAALLDDGNLVLVSEDRGVVWQSFETPSDTLLPGQRLTSSQTLRAAGRNSFSSYYSLLMDATGQLKLSWETHVSYWKTEASSPLPITAAVFTDDGALKLLDQRQTPVWSRFGDDHNDSSVGFRFVRLDVDGNLRMYSWAEGFKSWRSVWQAVHNQCDVFATCGQQGVCFFAPSGTSSCKCPFRSTPDSNSNCLAPYKRSCSFGTDMIELEHTFLYGIYPPEDAITRTSSDQCRNSCLQDPSCTSVTATNDGNAECLMKQTEFITGYDDPSITSVSFIKICLDPVATALPNSFPAPSPSFPSSSPLLKRPPRFCTACLIGAASGTLIAYFVIHLLVVLCLVRRRSRSRRANLHTRTASHLSLNSIGLVALSYSEIKDLTGNFKHRIGPNIYKGVLPSNQVVLIKDMKKDMTESGNTIEEKQFRCWISVLGSIHHKNLVKLEAYCCKSEQRFLVYQFAKNGSVEKWIEEAKLSRRLTWRKRMEICVGVARALVYLHSGCREFVSHGNLKWENVVLDEDMEAKVTEYGLGRLGGRVSRGSSAAEGDVASFGYMVVVIVSGRQDRDGDDVCRWAYKEWAEGGHVGKVVDSRVVGKIDVREVERALRVAFWCVQEDERLRPSMGEVCKVLEGILPVDPPPPPFACLREATREGAFQIGRHDLGNVE